MRIRSSVGALAVVALTGCVNIETRDSARTVRRETKTVELGQVELVRAEIKMGAGQVHLSGGARHLLDGEFEYDRDALKPVVRYDTSSFRGRLTVEQTGSGTMVLGKVKNNWKLKLNDEIPLDLVVHLGAGEGQVDAGRLALRSLEIHMGAGQLKVDLTGGEYKRNFQVQVHGGVGEAIVRLPKNAGVVADVHGGLGSIEAPGFEKRGGKYFNKAYETSEVRIEMSVHGGVGSIRLQQE